MDLTLADYFALLDLDRSSLRNGSGYGTVTQRYPLEERDGCNFPPGLATFALPKGWSMLSSWAPPEFFTCTLMDALGNRMYAHVLTFTAKDITPIVDELEELSQLFVPRAIAFVSRYPYFELFRGALSCIYSAAVNGSFEAEKMIATILTTKLKYDSLVSTFLGTTRLTFYFPLTTFLPYSETTVADLVSYIGTISNLIKIFRAVITDHKVILKSCSLQKLYRSCSAITSLIYPLDYSYVCISVVPSVIPDTLDLPSPYIMGIHTSSDFNLVDRDAFIVDLDTGDFIAPSGIFVPALPKTLEEKLVARLQMVVFPQLSGYDMVCPPAIPPKPARADFDKLIRACFLLFMIELFHGYRTCLQLIRLYPHPLIVFNRPAFMGLRGFTDKLVNDILGSQLFQLFIEKRGLPIRECDIFDEEIAKELKNFDLLEPCSEMTRLKEIKDALMMECKEIVSHREVPVINDKDATLDHAGFTFVEERVSDQITSLMLSSSNDATQAKIPQKLVPYLPIESVNVSDGANSRRLEVLNTCLDLIFENRLSEAKKLMRAVELSLVSVAAQVALCRHLSRSAVPVTRACLNPPQFDLVVRLLNAALRHVTANDENGIAYACLHICSLYSRRLSQGVQQFAYTCIQDHAVWTDHRFWENAFFHDVHELMRRQYGDLASADSPLSGSHPHNMFNLLEHPTGMDVAANLVSSIPPEDQLAAFIAQEHSIVFGQAKHYINLMIYLMVPLEPSRLRRMDQPKLEGSRHVNELKIKGSHDGDSRLSVHGEQSDCHDTDSVIADEGSQIVQNIGKILDRLCGSALLERDKLSSLKADIPGYVALHIDELEQVYAESRKLQVPPKAQILKPILSCPYEKDIHGGLRCVLLPSNPIPIDKIDSMPYYLPAEGALFLTNYRVIFKGRPLCPSVQDEAIVKWFPVMTLMTDKSSSIESLEKCGVLSLIPKKLAAGLHDFIHLRSSSFCVLRIAFDDEVTADQVDRFRQALSHMRMQQSDITDLFAFTPVSSVIQSRRKPQPKQSTLNFSRNIKRTIAKSTLKGSQTKALTGSSTLLRSLPTHSENVLHGGDSRCDSVSSLRGVLGTTRLRYYIDFQRLLLITENSLLQVTYENGYFGLTKSYPSRLVIPKGVHDSSLSHIAVSFNLNRFPVVTFSSENKALLIRGAGFSSSGILSGIRKQANLIAEATSGSHDSRLNDNSEENDSRSRRQHLNEYLQHLVAASPCSGGNFKDSKTITSLLSLDSDMMFSEDMSVSSCNTGTPDIQRSSIAGEFSRPTSILRGTSSRESGKLFNNYPNGGRDSHETRKVINVMNMIKRKPLYVMVEKGAKVPRAAPPCLEFLAVSYPTAANVKNAFKAFVKSIHPSSIDQAAANKPVDCAGYFLLISEFLSLALSASSIMSILDSSIALCIEDGWDATCVISSLIQFLLDPYYRTVEGFRMLIEKEWLAFGHQFSYRLLHTEDTHRSGDIAPFFLMFLDCIHQILQQYPSACQFNHFYIKYLAYHSQSTFFTSFLLDSEMDRFNIDADMPDGPPGPEENHRGCIFAYIDNQIKHYPALFLNRAYERYENPVIPATSIAALDPWDFYTEDFNHGAPYDIELALSELSESDEERMGGSETLSKQPHPVTEINAQAVCEHLWHRGSLTGLDLKDDEKGEVHELSLNDEDEIIAIAYKRRRIQKRCALQLLMKGISYVEASTNSRHLHKFEKYSATANDPHVCVVCNYALYGTVVRTGQKCRSCNAIVHDKCVLHATWMCGSAIPLKLKIENGNTMSRSYTAEDKNLTLDKEDLSERDVKIHPQPVHQGYLRKRGAKLKIWSLRWFVLDKEHFQLLYFDSESDSIPRGEINLINLGAIDIIPHGQRGTSAIIELKTARKTVLLLADKRADADIWKEKIEQVLHE